MRGQISRAIHTAPDAAVAAVGRHVLVELREAVRTSDQACYEVGGQSGSGAGLSAQTRDRALQLKADLLRAAAHQPPMNRPTASREDIDKAYAAAEAALSARDRAAFATLTGPPTASAQVTALCHWMLKLREHVSAQDDAHVAAFVRGLAAVQR